MKALPAVALLVSWLFAGGPASAGPLHLALLSDGAAHGDTVFLSPLFSRAAPAAAADDSFARERVLLAIREAAAAHGWAWAASLRPENLQWSAPSVPLTEKTRLAVQSARVDKLLNQARFRLRLANAPATPAFYAWCPLPAGPPSSSIAGASLSSSPPAKAVSEADALVSVRRPATLHLHSENSFAMLRVRVLQSGELGEVVRVRVAGNGHTLVARVAGPDFLDAAF